MCVCVCVCVCVCEKKELNPTELKHFEKEYKVFREWFFVEIFAIIEFSFFHLRSSRRVTI